VTVTRYGGGKVVAEVNSMSDQTNVVPIDAYAAAEESRRRLGERLKAIDAAIADLQNEIYKGQSLSEAERLDQAARQMLAAPNAAVAAQGSEARLSQLYGEREIAKRAFGIAQQTLVTERQRRNRAVARGLAPQHRIAVNKVGRCLAALAVALDELRGIERQVPGLAYLPPMGFPSVGSLKHPDSPVSYWFKRARKLNLLDDVSMAAE
jgi:hypothetical protein